MNNIKHINTGTFTEVKLNSLAQLCAIANAKVSPVRFQSLEEKVAIPSTGVGESRLEKAVVPGSKRSSCAVWRETGPVLFLQLGGLVLTSLLLEVSW